MSEYETAELIFSLVGYGMTAMALYFTVVSGYLVVAYLAGSDLRRSQILFINTLFIAFSGVLTFGTYSFFNGAAGFGGEDGPIVSWLAPVTASIQLMGIIGSTIFMHETRRHTDEQ